MFKNTLIIFLSVLLFACSTTSEQTQNDIENSNWQAVGQYDGDNGLPEKSQQELQALSDKLKGGKVDYPLYQKNYLAGVTVYCEPSNAPMLGKLGKPYFHACDRFPSGVFFYQDWLNAHSSIGN